MALWERLRLFQACWRQAQRKQRVKLALTVRRPRKSSPQTR